MAMVPRLMTPLQTLIGRQTGLNGTESAGWTAQSGMTHGT